MKTILLSLVMELGLCTFIENNCLNSSFCLNVEMLYQPFRMAVRGLFKQLQNDSFFSRELCCANCDDYLRHSKLVGYHQKFRLASAEKV